MSKERVLVFGNGFVASLLAESEDPRFDVVISKANVLDEAALRAAFEQHRPEVVVNTAAKTNIDWCESHRDITVQVNVRSSAARSLRSQGVSSYTCAVTVCSPAASVVASKHCEFALVTGAPSTDQSTCATAGSTRRTRSSRGLLRVASVAVLSSIGLTTR